MASFHSKTFTKHDDYATPKSAWEAIQQYIPNNKTIWEPFYCDGQSGKDLQSLGFTVYHQQEDFFLVEEPRGDIVVSNPPFTLKKEVLEKLMQFDIPFILIMPSSTIQTQYVRKLFSNKRLQIIIPRKRIQFLKVIDGKKIQQNDCNFDCFYFCYKLNLQQDIHFLH